MQVYLDRFHCKEDIISEFSISSSELDNAEIIYAEYGYENYEGDAFVIFFRDGALFEAHGSHCSCNGLEGCWRPEQVSLQGLIFRADVPERAKINLKQRFPNLIPFL